MNFLRNIDMKYEIANKKVEKPKAETNETLPSHDQLMDIFMITHIRVPSIMAKVLFINTY
ncbi:MAG TPA: hypothetical protein VH481_10845 [Nitrososphaeraceae archaeon]